MLMLIYLKIIAEFSIFCNFLLYVSEISTNLIIQYKTHVRNIQKFFSLHKITALLQNHYGLLQCFNHP